MVFGVLQLAATWGQKKTGIEPVFIWDPGRSLKAYLF